MNEPAITPELVAKHNLTPDEYQKVLEILGRTPTYTELGIFSVMWSEHCSYKNTRPVLKTFPTQGDWGYPGVRGVAVDVHGDVWVGTLETKELYYLEGGAGRILRTIDVSSVNHRTYGAVLDRSGILWASSHYRNEVLRLGPEPVLSRSFRSAISPTA